MTDLPTDHEPEPSHRREAAGIYGLIVTASVLATGGHSLHTLGLAIAVVVTLVIYWLAEEYAEVVGHARVGHLPSWHQVRSSLSAKWPLVSASLLPLAVLLLARALGASPYTAAIVSLVATIVLLGAYGWSAATTAGLRGTVRVVMTAAAGSLGLLMVGLKILLVQLH